MTSTYLLSWKLAEVIPLHKDGDPDNAPNNRPVSLLSSLSKICDKVALNQFTDYLMEHKLLTKHQSGNRKLHSTETLNIAVTDILLEAIDKKQLSIIIFLDLSKAFDSVQHDILLKEITDLGVTSEVLNWFKSYLSNRSQYVHIGSATSTCAALEHGIPQGSVLSPFLFNIYTDSLPSTTKSCNLE
jgi:retron-type reverse transcriptase